MPVPVTGAAGPLGRPWRLTWIGGQRARYRGPDAIPGQARAQGDRGHRPGELARPGSWRGHPAAVVVLERPESGVRFGRAVHAAVALSDRAARGGQRAGSDDLPGRWHADRTVAGAVPAKGRAAGMGGTASRAASGCDSSLMPVSELHRQVAAVALRAAAGHGFALGGGNALLAHGVTSRPTQDVDLFTDQDHSVEATASA